ncbi:DNA pilot protein [Tortoise microvirus 86]|nr:DNA pilot protein [Tortoise microvirus 86]
MGPLLAPLITAGAGLVSSGINAWSQSNTNRDQRNWNERMYEREKADKLAQWHMENEYNSPVSQMQRLRQAGLNPNLVYGKGADNIGGSIAPTATKNYSPTAPQFDLGGPVSSGLMSYYDIAMKEAQTDNLKAQNTVAYQEAALKAAATANTIQSTAKGEFELDMARTLRQNSLDFAEANLKKVQADTQFQLSENERRSIMQTQTLKESVERIMSMRAQRAHTHADVERIKAQTKNILNSNEFQKYDLEFKKLGINPSDPMYLRFLGRAVGTNSYGEAWNKIDSKTRETSSDFKDWLSDLFK